MGIKLDEFTKFYLFFFAVYFGIAIIYEIMKIAYSLLQLLDTILIGKKGIRVFLRKITSWLIMLISIVCKRLSKQKIVGEIFVKVLPFLFTVYTFIYLIRNLFLVLQYFALMFVDRSNPSIVNVVNYLVLSLVLVSVSYIPDIVGLWSYNLVGLLFLKNRKDKNSLYSSIVTNKRKIVKILRPRLIIYIFSVVISIANSIEKLSNTVLITYPAWRVIQPVVFESVVTLIVIDRLINVIHKEKNDLKTEMKDIFSNNNSTTTVRNLESL